MATDCPKHDEGYPCQFEGPPKHTTHGFYLHDQSAWVFWETPPLVEPSKVAGKRATKQDMLDKIHRIENTDPTNLARRDDHPTSQQSAKHAAIRSGSQKHSLLVAYSQHPEGLTDDEAAELAGLLGRPGCCWWHRSTDLRDEERIVSTGRTRTSKHTGEERMVCVITDYGRLSL